MHRVIIILIAAFLIISCKHGDNKMASDIRDSQKSSLPIARVEIEHLIVDSTLNVRAIEVLVKNNCLIYLSSDGRLGSFISDKERSTIHKQSQLNYNRVRPNFRSLHVNEDQGYGLSIGNPALLFKLDIDTEKGDIVYEEFNEKAFYDSMDFWNDQEGLAIGDPTENCMSIIITRDGGETWSKLPCDMLPVANQGEAAFAASDTNIAIVGEKTWVATGGVTSRILYSPNKGKSWEIFETPIIQGKETTGIYSIDFYDGLNGFAIGGDYTDPDSNYSNKIRTSDGGKNWQIVADGKSPGYRSCVRYVPNSKGKELIAVGFKGIDYSNDSGDNWKPLSDAGFYTIRFLNDSIAYAAGKGRISKLKLIREKSV